MLVPVARPGRVADEGALDRVPVVVVVVVDAGDGVGRVRQVDVGGVQDLAVAEHPLVAGLHAGLPVLELADAVESVFQEVAEIVAHGAPAPLSAGAMTTSTSVPFGPASRTVTCAMGTTSSPAPPPSGP